MPKIESESDVSDESSSDESGSEGYSDVETDCQVCFCIEKMSQHLLPQLLYTQYNYIYLSSNNMFYIFIFSCMGKSPASSTTAGVAARTV